MTDFTVLEDYDKWVNGRGALGVGAIPERIFIAGWLAGQRRAVIDADEMRAALVNLELVAGLVKNQADNSGKTPYTDWASACDDLDRARERAREAISKSISRDAESGESDNQRMSIRDHFAALAMQAAATNPIGAEGFNFDERAKWAYQQADAMLAARSA